MRETILTAIIVAGSLALLAYWFRYVCLLIFAARPTRSYAKAIAAINDLDFLNVQEKLRSEGPDVDALRASLDRDYALLMYLVTHSVHSAASVERSMLRVDYWIMRVSCCWTRRIAPGIAMRALDEMASIVVHFADTFGGQVRAADTCH